MKIKRKIIKIVIIIIKLKITSQLVKINISKKLIIMVIIK